MHAPCTVAQVNIAQVNVALEAVADAPLRAAFFTPHHPVAALGPGMIAAPALPR